MPGQLRVTYRKSAIGHPSDQRRTLESMGLRRLGQSVVVADDPVMRGMVRKVQHLVSVEPVEAPETPETAGPAARPEKAGA
ncbi:MAG: 50S ribosomal protein L30 [Limnochordaceae bacterium]|nr:50S ribosomal protein L30 [Limnochordaceae bacterium]